jgi:hypothetical protein
MKRDRKQVVGRAKSEAVDQEDMHFETSQRAMGGGAGGGGEGEGELLASYYPRCTRSIRKSKLDRASNELNVQNVLEQEQLICRRPVIHDH